MIYKSAIGQYAWTPNVLRRRFPKLQTAIYKLICLIA
jgi:hypothetical protein